VNACETLAAEASLGVAPALRAVDCLANASAASAFGRLFGPQGALLPALTILLTLYIAFFAISLLTGRSRIGISALTPRMMTMGLVLTFATSWVAWQGVVWNLAVGAPDQLAGILMGAPGSATQMFADRLDIVFAAIRQTAEIAGGAAPAGKEDGAFTPGNLMWLGTLLLLLGTVGVLVTARIALAVLLATGPVFVVLALFSGTRGLFAGWLRGLVMVALTPLFVVVGGGMMLELLVPVIGGLAGEGGGVSGQGAIALFLIACVHVALMAMVMKVTSTMVSGWQVFGLASGRQVDRTGAPASAGMTNAGAVAPAAAASPGFARTSGMASAGFQTVVVENGGGSPSSSSHSRTIVDRTASTAQPGLPPLARNRSRGIGSRFSSPRPKFKEMVR
jgi:type IV secretion system protein VirB6